jgi:hypothetical protein
MDVGLLQEIFKKYKKNKKVQNVDQAMEKLDLHERWAIATKLLFEEKILKNIVDVETLDGAELKQVFSALFDNFDVVKMLGSFSLDSLNEVHPEMIPMVIEREDQKILILIPWYLSEDFVQGILNKLKNKNPYISFEEVLDNLPFKFEDDIRYNFTTL